jgi:hypothetical protein
MTKYIIKQPTQTSNKMNKQIHVAASVALCSLLLAGCSDSVQPYAEGFGTISPTVSLDASVVTSKQAARSRAALADISVEDLKLTLTAALTGAVSEFQGVSNFPTNQKWSVGDYTLVASYGDVTDEGFEKPALSGSTTFTVEDGETSDVSLTASMQNTMVTVKYSDAFKNYMTSYSAVLHSSGGDYIDYADDETRPAYLRPGEVALNVTFTKPSGVSATIEAARFTAEAKHSYTVTIDLSNETGTPKLAVVFDELVEQEDVTIDISDLLLSTPAPTVTTSGFTSGETLSVVEGSTVSNPAIFNIMAKGLISSATLTTSSTSLISQGWPAEIDLANCTAAQQATLTSLGLKAAGLFRNPDMMAQLDLSNVLSKISPVDNDANGNVSTFTLEVKDKNSKVSDHVSFSVAIEQLTLALSYSGAYTGEDTIDLTCTSNGNNLADNVKVQYLNDFGGWSDAEIVSVTAQSRSRATTASTYTIKINTPSVNRTLEFRAIYGSKTTETVEVKVTSFEAAIASNNVYAKHALLTVNTPDDNNSSAASIASKCKVYLSTDNGSTYAIATSSTDGSNYITVSGLNAETTYLARVEVNGIKSNRASFTTEATPQLPNSGMESWYTEQPFSQYQLLYYAGSSSSDCAWGTMNNLTTSTGGSGNSVTSYGGTSYRATSGTKSTTDAKTGSYAALIRTVGWGSKNTAAGTAVGTCSNITAGELYLGSYNSSTSSPNYGYAFAARPSALKFNYKYSVVKSGNGDYGVAEIKILDASGNVVASNSVKIAEQSSYASLTVPLTYAANSAKCATIQVNFKSSGNSAALTKSSTYMTFPALANYTDGEYVGSQLYVDDIELVY